uniref:Nucleoporin Nup188 N-terminal subdomain III domain-containing protein n=1 Tax=Timema tahoe TaxID=61484 RepID=A0A7R9IDM7_9NEOP|nr:unnamed protein product [Timema tahoe]
MNSLGMIQEPTELSSIAHDLIYKLLHWIMSYGVQNLQPKTVANVTVSMKILANIVHSGFIVEGDMVLPVEAAIELMAKFTDVLEPPNQLLANCLDIVTYLWMDYRDEMYFKLDVIKFLPHVNSLDISPISCINGKFHCGGSLGPIVVVQEFSSTEYPLLKSFLQFVQVLLEFDPETVAKFEKSGNDYSDKLKYTIEKNFKLLLPAMSYILFEVFPTYNNWRYKKNEDHSFISRSCLSIFHKLISINTKKDIIDYLNPGEILHLMCFYNLLEGGAILPLLKIVGTGNGMLQLLMESQLNWDTGPGVDFINLVRLALALLNMTLRLKTTKDMNYLCPLEAKIMYYPNDKNHLRILHSTVDYIYHTFNPNLPTLAVELMRSFAMDFHVSLITCLGVDPEILRHCFIRHLESSEEPTHLKVAIFNFLNACVLKQSGLAEMLINIECPTEIPRDFPNPQITSGKQGGCLLYACELLANLEEVPAHFEFTVQCMEVLLFIANSSLSSMFIDSYALVNVWLAALPPLTGEAHKVLRYSCNLFTVGELLKIASSRLLQGLLDVTHQALVAEWKEGYQGLRHSTVKSVITCINRLVAMLNNPSYVKDALENQGKCSKNIKDKSYANEEFIGVMNMCLKTIYMCFGVLLPLSPKIEHMVSLSQESLKFWQPLVDATFANPILTNRAQPILTFGALISIVNSTQSHSHIKAFNSPTSPFTSPDIKWTSKLDKQLTPALLEMCMTKYHLMKIGLNNFVDWMGMGKETGNVGMHYKREFGSLSSKDKVLKFWKPAPGNPHNLATSSALTSLNSPSLLVHVMMLLYWLLINSSNKNCHNVMLVSMATETKHNFEQ